jgi:hypothetical protein
MRFRYSPASRLAWLVGCGCLFVSSAVAQVNVTTYHNDNARSGQNTAETTLTLANVNFNQFGKLFSVGVDGYVYAQPLYLSNVRINGGTHNVVYAATEHDSLYAIDADNGTMYWKVNLIPAGGNSVDSNTDAGCGDLIPEIGITGTPVIDTSTSTIYLVTNTKENGKFFQRLHAIDVVTHAEKFGGPVVITASVSGTGDGSSGGKVSFDPLKENQRPGLLLQNGHVLIGWASHCDIGPYHGWIMSYSANTLAQEAVFNTAPNGGLAGVWMSGAGLAGDASGNTYFATGNGTWDGITAFGDSIVKLQAPSGGAFSLADWFTAFNQSSLSGGDTDLGSGGGLLLPSLPSGQKLLVQSGKEGRIYLIDTNNMGRFCSSCTSSDTQIAQELPAGTLGGMWSMPAYWNDTVYFWGSGDVMRSFSFNSGGSGLLSASPIGTSPDSYGFPGATPSISANSNSNGIAWSLQTDAYLSNGPAILKAHNASNVAQILYTSSQAPNNRDRLAGAVKFAVPTVANGKVYVGTNGQLSVFGLLNTTPTAATPTFSPAPGSYTSSITVTVSDSTPNATSHCTTDGSPPTPSSPVCTSVTISTTTTLQAIATANGFNSSAVAGGTYSIVSGTGINYGNGFTSSGLTLNGTATINGTRLRLTDGGANEAASAFFTTPINVQNFTTDFSFQLSNPGADGMTFTIQGTGVTALGPLGGGLGYGPDTPGGPPGIGKSVAVKFDLYNNAGEGTDSTGMYTNGASPTTPARDMTSSAVNLHSGDVFNVHMTYDGTTLAMTITDANTPAQKFSTSWAINIPSTVGGNTAFVGFTGGTGGLTAIQEVMAWTYTSPSGLPTAATPTFSPPPGTYNSAQTVTLSDATSGATIHCTTDGTTPTPSSPACTTVNVAVTTAIKAIAAANGFNPSPVAVGQYTIVTKTPITYETEKLTAVSSGPVFRVFNYSGFPDGVGTILDSTKVGDSVTFTLNIAQAGTYDVQVSVKKFTLRGIWQLAVNGQNVGPQKDEYNASEAYAVFDLGNMNITTAGNYAFKFTIVGKNPAATDFKEAFDFIKLTPQ